MIVFCHRLIQRLGGSQADAGFQKALEFAKFRDAVDGYNTVTNMYAAVIENVAFDLMSVDEAIENFEIEMVASMGADLVKVINK